MPLTPGEQFTDEVIADAWRAAECLVSSDLERRRKGLDRFVEGDALSFSPLVGCLLATRLHEPDLALRGRVVNALANFMEDQGNASTRWQMDQKPVFALLATYGRKEVERLLETATIQGSRGAMVTVLDRIPNLGSLLPRIAADRGAALPLRLAAVSVAAELGVIEALPALEGLKTRIEGRAAGQLAMTFAPRSGAGEDILLETLKAAIDTLRANE
jgi:hypothetical protein